MITLATWECGHVEIDDGSIHECDGREVCSATYQRAVLLGDGADDLVAVCALYLSETRGHDIPGSHITAGDVLVIHKADSTEPGRLVIQPGDGEVAHLLKYEPGMSIFGVVIGLMRRYDR